MRGRIIVVVAAVRMCFFSRKEIASIYCDRELNTLGKHSLYIRMIEREREGRRKERESVREGWRI